MRGRISGIASDDGGAARRGLSPIVWQRPARLDGRRVLALQLAKLVGESQGMTERATYQYLKPKPGSNYRQLFVNGRIRAEILYRETIGVEPLTPEDVAREYELPVAAVREAIAYCLQHRDLLDTERAREDARIKAAGRDQWPYAPRTSRPAG
jgi:hypothetical protein